MTTPLDVLAPRVLYCHCAYAAVVPKATKEAVLRGLTDAGIAFDAVPDLCELSARRDKRFSPTNMRGSKCSSIGIGWGKRTRTRRVSSGSAPFGRALAGASSRSRVLARK